MASFRNPRVLVGLVLLLLAGCGFKLRGQAQLPPELAVTYIKPPGSRPDDLSSTLERTLVANGVKVIGDPQAATATLEILREEVRRRAIAAGAGGEAWEYTLAYTVTYQVTLPNGKQLIAPETLSTSRNLLFDERRVLGRAAGEEILIRDMASDLSRSIILRLQAARL